MALLGNLLRVLHQLRKHLHCQSLSSQLSPEGAGFCNVWAALRKLVSQTELSLNLTLYFPEIQLQEGGSHWECLLWNLKKLNSNFHCNHWTAFVHVRFQGLWVHSCCWHVLVIPWMSPHTSKLWHIILCHLFCTVWSVLWVLHSVGCVWSGCSVSPAGLSFHSTCPGGAAQPVCLQELCCYTAPSQLKALGANARDPHWPKKQLEQRCWQKNEGLGAG